MLAKHNTATYRGAIAHPSIRAANLKVLIFLYLANPIHKLALNVVKYIFIGYLSYMYHIWIFENICILVFIKYIWKISCRNRSSWVTSHDSPRQKEKISQVPLENKRITIFTLVLSHLWILQGLKELMPTQKTIALWFHSIHNPRSILLHRYYNCFLD